MSKKGGVSESLGLLSRVSGETAATEASLERKGSLGLSGGKRILEALIALKRHRLRDDEQGNEEEEAIGAPKELAMDSVDRRMNFCFCRVKRLILVLGTWF